MKNIEKKDRDLRLILKLQHPQKRTALFALKQALIRERYEVCSKIIAVAKEHGAEEREIYHLLEDPRRSFD